MKTFVVKGYAMIPVEVEITVQARGEASAGRKAERDFKSLGRKAIVPGSADEGAVHDFRWSSAEEVPS